MHITLISACHLRALKRSRAILDSYAIRTGERSWATPITQEGLVALRMLLARQATRQTAVACYQNTGRSQMKLLWIVGSRKAFGPKGHFPAGITRVRKTTAQPAWLRLLCLLAQTAGYAHDLGKSSEDFAAKLASAVRPPRAGREPPQERARHEWLSMRLLPALAHAGETSDAAALWAALTNTSPTQSPPLPDWQIQGLRTVADALGFIVATHHRLCAPLSGGGTPTPEAHVSRPNALNEIGPAQIPWDQNPIPPLKHAWKRLLEKSPTLIPPEQALSYWRGLAILARAALILADHTISSQPYPKPKSRPTGVLFANTKREDKPVPRYFYDQPLGWHLKTVGDEAAKMAQRMMTMALPGLSESSRDQILMPTPHPQFVWQNRAAAAMSTLREKSGAPVLVLNLAATGTGKTRANLKLAASLRARCRVAIALNLRTLTLQTGESIRRDFRLGPDELATVIGERTVQALFENSMPNAFEEPLEAEKSTPGAPLSTNYETWGEDGVPLPGWMDVLVAKSPQQRHLIGTPVLVSTVDYLVSAGEPGRQGHHVSALLRLIDSDIVLDEIDAYDPKALVAILRLVQMAAFLGRNVVCASATLALPVAQKVHEAFAHGIHLRSTLQHTPAAWHVAMVNDLIPPVIQDFREANAQAPLAYPEYIARVSAALAENAAQTPYRPAMLRAVGGATKGSRPTHRDFEEAIFRSCQLLHRTHAWETGFRGQRISFGLVRMANIRPAVRVAQALIAKVSDAFPALIACYHANDFLIQRHLKEQWLDRLLKRTHPTAPNAHIVRDPEIRRLLEQFPENSHVAFIVVATPVEEVGRDHDFDWAVIEPSSVQSIVQTAGRVNRHRKIAVKQPNVMILQYNYRALTLPGLRDGPAFVWPGLETTPFQVRNTPGSKAAPEDIPTYRDTNLQKLLPPLAQSNLRPDHIPGIAHLDARVRFDVNTYPFAQDEDNLWQRLLEKPMEVLKADAGVGASRWMAQAFYRDYPLRARAQKDTWVAVWEAPHWHLEKNGTIRTLKAGLGSAPDAESVAKTWLSWPMAHLLSVCERLGVAPEKGLSVQLHSVSENRLRYQQAFGFWFEPPDP